MALHIAAIEEWHWQHVQAKVPKPAEVIPIAPSESKTTKEILEKQKETKHWAVPDGAGWTTCLYCRRRARKHKYATWRKPCEATVVQIGRIAISFRDKGFVVEQTSVDDSDGDDGMQNDEVMQRAEREESDAEI